MQNLNKICELINKKKLTKKFVYEKLGYSQSGFNKEIKLGTFKNEALLKLSEIFEVDKFYFIGNEQKYDNIEKSIVEEDTVLYKKIDTDDLLIKIISRLDTIIELLEKR